MGIKRVLADSVMLKNGVVRHLCRVGKMCDQLTAFAKTLTHDDRIVIVVTDEASVVAEMLRRHAAVSGARPMPTV